MGVPKMDALQWKILLKWRIWGYPYFRKPPYVLIRIHLDTIPVASRSELENTFAFQAQIARASLLRSAGIDSICKHLVSHQELFGFRENV